MKKILIFSGICFLLSYQTTYASFLLKKKTAIEYKDENSISSNVNSKLQHVSAINHSGNLFKRVSNSFDIPFYGAAKKLVSKSHSEGLSVLRHFKDYYHDHRNIWPFLIVAIVLTVVVVVVCIIFLLGGALTVTG